MSITHEWAQRRQIRELRRRLLKGRADPSWWRVAQRLLAGLMLFAALPLLICLYPLVRLTSPGPFLFKQERPGQNGKPFIALKIRTMREGSDRDKTLARSVRSENPLVTPIGRLLRDLKLDELPQLWNVVRGEMALVGPRPLAIVFQQELEREIPGFTQRLRVRPGLTSLAQVAVLESAAEEGVVQDWRRRFQAERHYLYNRSPLYDLSVLALTAAYVFRKLARKLQTQRARVLGLGLALLAVLSVTACSPALDRNGLTSDSDILRKEVNLDEPGRARSPVERQIVSLPSSASTDATDPHYRVGAADELSINVFGEPGLTDLTVRVNAAGMIQVPILELVSVGGKTTAEIQAELKRAFTAHFNDPWVVVHLVDFRSRPIYLIGEFNEPGVVYLDSPTNIVQALGLGSGLSAQAYLPGARLLRDNEIVPVDIKALLRDGRFDQNIWLHAGDTIYVPGHQDLKVYLLGAVGQAGPHPFGNGLTLMEALVHARGPKAGAAELQEVRIIRTHSPIRGELMVVDLEKILIGESPDLPLQAGDIIYVPQGPLADWNDVIAMIAPTIGLISGTLEPFVQLKFLRDN